MARIQTLRQLENLNNFPSFFKPKTISNHVVASLAKEGERIIKEAYSSRNWKNRTYNLYNSYVAAVIVSGKIRKIMYLGPEHAPSPEYQKGGMYGKKYHDTIRVYGAVDIERGRREANNFVMSYAAQHRKGVVLVVGAAMFYAGILESKGYHVLAGIDENMRAIQAKGIVLTDYKVGNMFPGLKDGSDAQIKIGSNHIAYRREEDDWGRAKKRKKTFDTKIGE